MNKDGANKEIDKTLTKSANLFPVVGIGASAGGLDAFKKLLKAIPEDSGMAYVLVQHLHPEHESFLTEILQRVTKIPVIEISDDIKVEPNHIYIIPSNKMLIANDGKLELSARPAKTPNKLNLPIDLFFESLAEIHQTHAIGVVLSGTGADGTLGLKAIKDNGGITIAQNMESADYDSMPAHAIQADVVDFILTPEEIPQKLLDIVPQINLSDEELKNLSQQDEDVFKQILSLLRIRKGTDFTYYKQTTIRRRILRRMAINKNEQHAVYYKFLKGNKPEQDLLYQDLLIPVTTFFRDSKVFDSLCQTVLPTIVKNKSATAPIRLWVTACSTGQEAYSMAMCLKEYLSNNSEQVQIFATDISVPAIAKARSGIYTKDEVAELSPQRLQDFFTKTESGYMVNKEIREMCIFAVHNFLKDPPFGKIDFVSCRNVLIYMEPYLQKKALTTFHYSLNPKGFLLLGKSETSSSVPDLFLAVGKNEKIFTRKDAPGSFMHVATQRREQNLNEINSNPSKEIMQTDFQKTADEIMLSKYTPAGVVVNDAMDIVHFRGNTNIYLEQSPGKPTHNLLKMAKNGLAFELRNIIHKAKKENTAVTKDNIPLQINGSQRIITIEAMPLPNVVEPHFLILFHGNEFSQINQQSLINTQSSSTLKKDEKDLYIVQIERELAQTREDMRSITEDQEASNEELQSANEELLSGSEELQSLNEELETSKEEMQSTNEELTVVNQELVSLNVQVTTAQQYAESIISTIREPLLVLDKNLRVKTANKAFYKLFDVNEKETEGNLLYKLGNSQWDIPSLRTLLEEILTDKETFTDFEVEHHFPYIGKKILLLNAREIKGVGGAENLILLVMEDVTEQKKYQLQDDAFLGRFKNILLQSAVGVAVFKGMRFHVEMANEMFLTIAGKQEKEFVGKPLFETMPETRNFLEPMLLEVFQTGIPHNGNEIEYSINSPEKNATGYYNYTYQPMYDKDGNVNGIISVVNDVTEQVNARKKVEESELFSRNLIENSPDCVKILDEEGHLDFVNSNGLCLLEIDDFATVKNKYWWEIWGKENQKIVKEAVEKAKRGEKVQFQAFQETAKGTPKWWDVIVLPLQATNDSKKVSQILSVSRDITAQKQIEVREKELLSRFQSLVLQAPVAICVLRGENYTVEIINKGMAKMWDIKQEDILDKPAFDVLPELLNHGFKELLEDVYSNGKRIVVEELPIILNKDGKPENGFVKFVYEPMLDADGSVSGVMALAIEITEQVSARKKVEESESRFRNLVEKAPSPICIFNGEKMIMEMANAPLLKIFNVGIEAFGKSFFEILPEMKDQPFMGWLQNVYKNGVTHYGNEEPAYFIRENGEKETMYFNFVYQPLHEHDGSISGVMVQASDVTALVVARKKMEVQAIMVQDLMLTAPAFICTLMGPDHVYDLVNKRYQALFGKRNIQGKPIMIALAELKGQGFDTILDNVYQTGKPFIGIDVPITLARDEGLEPQLSYFNFSYQPMYNGLKEIDGILVFGYEVTEQVIARNKNLETEQSHSKELEEKVQQRTLELIDANELLNAINIEKEARAAELVIANKELKFQNEEKEKRAHELGIANKELLAFNYISSHDLQEPLRKIQTFATLIAEKEYGSLSEKGKDYFLRMEESARRMQTLIEDLLAYSRTNFTDRKFVRLHINKIVEDTLYEMSDFIQQKNATVEVVELCEVDVIPFQMRQIMTNMITNAIKFTLPDVAPHIVISCKTDRALNFNDEISKLSTERLSSKKDYCRITFKDNGIGFDPRYKDKIFEVFQRLHGKDAYPGTGIGLAIVKKIVQNHNGVITAEGKLKEGAIFNIYLPEL